MSRNICSQLGTLAVVPFLWRSLVAAIASTITVTASPAETYSTYRVLYVEDIPDRIISDQIPLDAFGYLGGLLEARFYEPHSTTNDPRSEIQDAASLYGLDLAMMMSIAKVESDFNPGARTGSYKGLFQLSDYEFNKYGDGSIWDARDNARAAAHMFWFKPKCSEERLVTIRITLRDTWCISKVSKARLNITHIPSALHGSPCARPTKAC